MERNQPKARSTRALAIVLAVVGLACLAVLAWLGGGVQPPTADRLQRWIVGLVLAIVLVSLAVLATRLIQPYRRATKQIADLEGRLRAADAAQRSLLQGVQIGR